MIFLYSIVWKKRDWQQTMRERQRKRERGLYMQQRSPRTWTEDDMVLGHVHEPLISHWCVFNCFWTTVALICEQNRVWDWHTRWQHALWSPRKTAWWPLFHGLGYSTAACSCSGYSVFQLETEQLLGQTLTPATSLPKPRCFHKGHQRSSSAYMHSNKTGQELSDTPTTHTHTHT